jgi:hypothetical protein
MRRMTEGGTGMSYLLLVLEPHGQRAQRSNAEAHDAYARMQAYADELKTRGVLLAYSSLRNDAEGQRLQIRGGKHTVRDGPFTEAGEMIGGFFLVDCAMRDQALELAAMCPAAQWATLEVRETGPCYLG